MSKRIVFEVIEQIDLTKASAKLYESKEDAWKNIGYMVDKFVKFVEEHKNAVDITGFEIDPEQSIVCIEYVYKKNHTTQYRFYEIKTRFIF